jgi:tetratricopeptide (TPR) repeat protein
MSLSDREINDLLDEGKSYMEAADQTAPADIQYLQRAFDCYNRLIENAPPHPFYFERRAQITRLLNARGSIYHKVDDAIMDMNKAIELDPDNAHYYLVRGVFLSSKLEENISNVQLLENIAEDYKASECVKQNETLQTRIYCSTDSLTL